MNEGARGREGEGEYRGGHLHLTLTLTLTLTSTIFPSPSKPRPSAQKSTSGFHLPAKSEDEEAKRCAISTTNQENRKGEGRKEKKISPFSSRPSWSCLGKGKKDSQLILGWVSGLHVDDKAECRSSPRPQARCGCTEENLHVGLHILHILEQFVCRSGSVHAKHLVSGLHWQARFKE